MCMRYALHCVVRVLQTNLADEEQARCQKAMKAGPFCKVLPSQQGRDLFVYDTAGTDCQTPPRAATSDPLAYFFSGALSSMV
jgi:hypothetical protein